MFIKNFCHIGLVRSFPGSIGADNFGQSSDTDKSLNDQSVLVIRGC